MTTRDHDFRSDTITRPTPAMREAMAQAPVGDDVFGDDPTVVELQQRLAEMLGKEAALFVPSGTMSNQLAIRVHCLPGDELICEADCHIYNYEQGGNAQLSGVSTRTVAGHGAIIDVNQLHGLVRVDNEQRVRTGLLCRESTHNRGAGRGYPLHGISEICAWAASENLRTHLDGARLFNAVVATGTEAKSWAHNFDTVSVCFSKGLGAPVGSALAGTKEAIRSAHRHRKVFGGGMRQAGIIAAGALYALENHVERLAEDHANAARLADAVREISGLELTCDPVETNIVIFRVASELGTAGDFCARMEAERVRMLALGPDTIRAVTHLDVDESDVGVACDVLRDVAASGATGAATAQSSPYV